MDVVGKPTPPKVVKELDPKELTIPGKTDLKLNCRITGFPMPKIKWLRDGNEIKVRKGVLVSQDASGNATLVIEKAQVLFFKYFILYFVIKLINTLLIIINDDNTASINFAESSGNVNALQGWWIGSQSHK